MASSRITGTNENIQTYGDGTRNFTSLSTWESATDNDLVTGTTSEVLECYDDAASFDDSITLEDATTSSLYFRIIRAAAGEGHDGTPNNGVYFSPSANISAFNLREANASVQDVRASATVNDGNARGPFHAGNAAAGITFIGCISFNNTNAGVGGTGGFTFENSTSTKMVNCLAIGNDFGFITENAGTGYCYNCTAIGGGSGFLVNNAGATFVAINCLAYNGSGNDFRNIAGSTTGSQNNASSDATVFGSTNVHTSQIFTFVDSASNDYRLHRNDLGAKFRGTNLSADATFAFDDDIDGDTITNWSIGFHAEETQQSSRRTGDNENVSTYAASGANYSSLSVWEAATDNDLVTGAVTEVLECASGVYDDTVSMAGATTDGRYFRIIRPASGAKHNGLPGSGVRFTATTLTSNCVLQINENFSSIQDVVVSTTVSSASTNFGIQTGASCDYGTVVGCIANAVGNAGAGGANGFGSATGSDRCRIAKCLAIGCKTAGFAHNGTSVNMVMTNNTSTGSPTGFAKGAGASVIAINNLAHNNGTAGYSGTYATGTTNNASAAADAPGSNNRNSQTFKFVNSSSNDFHLSVADAGAKGFGTNLTAGNWYNFNDDVDSATVSTWSIGFDSDPNHAKGKSGAARLATKVHGVLV